MLRSVLREHIRSGAFVVDGGAHIGYHTLAAARLMGPEGRIMAFEPHPETFRLLTDNVARNGYADQVTCINGALSDRTGDGKLHLSPFTSGDHRVVESAEDRSALDIQTYRLDDIIPEAQRVDFLKLDVQGAELAVLHGMEAVLERSPRLVLALEFAPFVLPPSVSAAALLAYLRERFDFLYDVDEETMTVTAAIDSKLLHGYTPENERFTNLLCLR